MKPLKLFVGLLLGLMLSSSVLAQVVVKTRNASALSGIEGCIAVGDLILVSPESKPTLKPVGVIEISGTTGSVLVKAIDWDKRRPVPVEHQEGTGVYVISTPGVFWVQVFETGEVELPGGQMFPWEKLRHEIFDFKVDGDSPSPTPEPTPGPDPGPPTPQPNPFDAGSIAFSIFEATRLVPASETKPKIAAELADAFRLAASQGAALSHMTAQDIVTMTSKEAKKINGIETWNAWQTEYLRLAKNEWKLGDDKEKHISAWLEISEALRAVK